MTIRYLSPATYPSPFANRLQVLKMTEAFFRTEKITLFIQSLDIPSEQLFARNGIPAVFPVKTVGTASAWPRGFWYARAMKRQAINTAPPDTIFYCRDIVLASWLIVLSKRFRNNFFFESHSVHRFSPRTYKKVFTYARGIITTNENSRAAMIAWDIPEDAIITKPNALDGARFARMPDKKTARQNLTLPQDKIIALYIGQFTEDRGIQTFIEAARIAENTQFYFIAAGGTDKEITREQARNLPMSLELVGRIPYDKVPLYMAAADIMIAPFSAQFPNLMQYASPLKIPEYMASGRPIIASDVPMVRRWLSEESAYLVRPDDPRALMEIINAAMTNGIQNKQMTETNRARALHYTWDARAKDILDFMQKRIRAHLKNNEEMK